MDEARIDATLTAPAGVAAGGAWSEDGAALHAVIARRSDAPAVGSVDSIWRYPVKSMAGEQLRSASVTARGILGDRVYALVDPASNRTASVRTWAAGLLSYRAQFLSEPEAAAPPPGLRISPPSGLALHSTDDDVDEHFSAAFGRKLMLVATVPEGLLVELPEGTLGVTRRGAQDLPIASAATPGTFVDYGCVHVIATCTVNHLQQAYPEGR